MSDYGADLNPDMQKAIDLAQTKGFLPLDKTNVMQWSDEDEILFQKLANKIGKSNVLVKLSDAGPFFPPPHPLDPVPAGDACAFCWGNGKPYGVGETPESVEVVIEDIEKGPGWIPANGEPPDGVFTLDQDGAQSCQFFFFDASYFIAFNTDAVSSVLIIFTADFLTQIFDSSGVQCHTSYENTTADPFVGGTVTVYIPPIA